MFDMIEKTNLKHKRNFRLFIEFFGWRSRNERRWRSKEFVRAKNRSTGENRSSARRSIAQRRAAKSDFSDEERRSTAPIGSRELRFDPCWSCPTERRDGRRSRDPNGRVHLDNDELDEKRWPIRILMDKSNRSSTGRKITRSPTRLNSGFFEHFANGTVGWRRENERVVFDKIRISYRDLRKVPLRLNDRRSTESKERIAQLTAGQLDEQSRRSFVDESFSYLPEFQISNAFFDHQQLVGFLSQHGTAESNWNSSFCLSDRNRTSLPWWLQTREFEFSEERRTNWRGETRNQRFIRQ